MMLITITIITNNIIEHLLNCQALFYMVYIKNPTAPPQKWMYILYYSDFTSLKIKSVVSFSHSYYVAEAEFKPSLVLISVLPGKESRGHCRSTL